MTVRLSLLKIGKSHPELRQGRGYARTYTSAEIATKLQIVERFRKDGMRMFEIARRLGVADSTIYNWRKQHAASTEKKIEVELSAMRREIAKLQEQIAGLKAAAR